MNYFNTRENDFLISGIKKKSTEEFSILEIGCDCGANLLEIQNRFPNANTYGVEINPAAAAIASHISKVQVANIEEKLLDFEGEQFDYIIFGDVLEHLRDLKGAILYCRSLLKEDGRMIASIPNLMHYSVMRQLLNGNFSYTETGLLDRTHIHFFTYNEICRMFQETGYQIEHIFHTRVGTPSESDVEFVNKLKSMSSDTKEFMFWAFQYNVTVKLNTSENDRILRWCERAYFKNLLKLKKEDTSKIKENLHFFCTI